MLSLWKSVTSLSGSRNLQHAHSAEISISKHGVNNKKKKLCNMVSQYCEVVSFAAYLFV